MDFNALGAFWSEQQIIDGKWMHPDDASRLLGHRHPFNLDHPVVPFVGDVQAEVVILGANGRYSERTPRSFAEKSDVEDFLKQVALGRTTR